MLAPARVRITNFTSSAALPLRAEIQRTTSLLMTPHDRAMALMARRIPQPPAPALDGDVWTVAKKMPNNPHAYAQCRKWVTREHVYVHRYGRTKYTCLIAGMT